MIKLLQKQNGAVFYASQCIYVNHKHRDIVQSNDLKTHLYEVMHCWRATTIGR